jgi:ABC-type branched-subunit amino acid transport system ATPase component/ABC-type branched-subunit amino acid transport system permease subunit
MKRLILINGPEILLVVFLAAIPLLINNTFLLGLLTLLAIYGILLIGLDITVGYLGQVNLAQAAFLGLGAYTAAITVKLLGLDLASALAAAAFVGAFFGGLLAFPALRLEGPQFALSTLSFMVLTSTILNEWESLTAGAQGFNVLRSPLFGLTLNAKGFFWLCLVILMLVWLAMRNLLSSQWGRAFEALRDSPIATDAMGIGTHRHKAAAFILGSGLGGLAGGLYAFNFQFLQPQIFIYDLMVILLLGVVLGGRKSLWGAFVGATIVVLLPNLLSNRFLFQIFSGIGFALALAAGIRGLASKKIKPFQALAPVVAMGLLVAGGLLVDNTEDWRKAIFALMLFSVVVGLPDGLMGFAARFLTSLFRIAPPALPKASSIESLLSCSRSSEKPILEVRGLQRHFGGVRAVDGVSLSIHPGTIHGLIGPNGSGKSTLVNVISGLYTPTRGEMRLYGEPLPQGSLFAVAHRGIARTFQNLQIFSELSALDNIMVAMKGIHREPLPLVLLGLAGRIERRTQADALAFLNLVGLADQARTPAKDLPYGAQRFLEIARALARRPQLLILDEPAAGLANPDVLNLLEIIRKIRNSGITILLIEHHMDVVSELCDKVTVLDGGRVIAEGPPDQIKRDPKVVEAYLGTHGAESGVMVTVEEKSPGSMTSGPAVSKPMLEVDGLYAGYGASRVLAGTSLKVNQGSVVALIGPNSAGKTTTMRAVSGELKPTGGRVVLDGREVQGLDASRIARLGLAHAPEGRRVFGPLTAEDNLLLGAFGHLPRFYGFQSRAAEDLERVYTLFPQLRERRSQTAGTLSGGEQQMLAIGRALMAKPKVMLLDEPSMGLAPVIVDEVFKIIEKLKESGITLLLVEQAAKRALEVADYAYVMERGRVVMEGYPADLQRDTKMIAAYLG